VFHPFPATQGPAGAYHGAFQHCVQQAGEAGGGIQSTDCGEGAACFGQQYGQGLALLSGPENGWAGEPVGASEGFRRFDQGGEEFFRRQNGGGEAAEQGRAARFQPGEQITGLGAVLRLAQGKAQGGDAGAGARATQGKEFQLPGAIAAGGGGQAGGGERMLEQGQQGNRG